MTLRFPLKRRDSAISRCCHAGKRMSLATPMTSVGISRRGDRPRIKSLGGREDAGFAGDEGESDSPSNSALL